MSHWLRSFASAAVPLFLTLIGPLHAQPPTPHIAWSQLTTELTLTQAASTAKTVAFVSDQPLQNVAILADSALAPYLTFEPALIAALPAGREQHIKITAAGVPPLELDPDVERVHRTAWEEMTDAARTHHHVHLRRRTRRSGRGWPWPSTSATRAARRCPSSWTSPSTS